MFVALMTMMMALSVQAQALPGAAFQAGVNYEVLPAPVRTADPSTIEVTELFWYGCGHCFHFEPLLENWKKTLPADVKFVPSPAIWNSQMEVHAKAFYTAQALGVLDKVHRPIFEAMNLKKQRLQNEAELAELFAAHGVKAEEFSKVFNSFSVNSQARQADARARSYRISGTPEVVVNGKYRVSAKLAGSQEKILDVVDYLIELERQAKAQ
jgi:thiol:disulfide interchange protein DsbA